MPTSLSPEQIETYRRDGVLNGIPVDTSDQVAEYRRQFDQLEAAEGTERSQNRIFDWHFDQQFLWEIATHPKILDCVAALYGPDILLLSTHVFCKYGPSTGFVAWHQDLTYWGLDPLEEVTAWYAIDDSDRENGCMRVIPRRHGQRILEHGKSRQAGNLLSVNQEVAVSVEDDSSAIDCVLRAGEISLHEGTAIHGSLPNRSTRRRCGVTARYVPAHVRPTAEGPIGTDWKWRPILVRGAYTESHFQLAPPPFPARAKHGK